MLDQMKTFTIAALSGLALLAFGTGQVFAVGAKAGNIRVLKVKGEVSLTVDKAQTTEPLKEGVYVQQEQIIKTGKNSEAVLLLSNGTTITVEQGTSFHVDKFLQAPFDSTKIIYKGLKNEPSTSQTKLHVQEGSIVADVCKLGKGSTFDIGTPVGVAGIRGTIIRVTVSRPNGAGEVSVTVDMPQGAAEFAGVDGRTITLSDGTTITIRLQPNGTTVTEGNVTPLTPQETQEIQALVEEALSLVPTEQTFDGVPDGSPEELDGTKRWTPKFGPVSKL